MEKYKGEFIDFLLEKGALKIGEFKLKSGRISPYFVSTGVFDDGESISRLGYFYASNIMDSVGADNFDLIFGPAYKGIPLAVTTAISLSRDFGVNKGYSFNRKEAKDYGDAELVIGYKIRDGDRVVIVDDVFTTGGTKYEAIDLLNGMAENLKYPALVIAVDRQEVDDEGVSAIKKFEEETKIPVGSIVNISEIIEYLSKEGKINKPEIERLKEYLRRYGIDEIKGG